MNTSWKRLLFVVAALLSITLIVTACGGAEPEPAPAPTEEPAEEEAAPEPTEEPAEEEAAPEPTEEPAEEEVAEEETPADTDEPVTIKWFMRWDQTRVDNVAMPVIEAFEAENPNIKVEFENIGSSSEYYQKLQTMVAGGLAPDVFYPATHVAYAYASKGAMGFIDEFIDADGLDMDAYDQNILQLYQYEGKQYCLPIDTANLVVFYNQEMFDAAGVAYPEDGWSWDDFLTTAQALTADTDDDGIIDQFGTDQFVNYWPAVVWSQTGHNIFNDKRGPTEFLLTDPAAVEAVQWVADLINVHGVMPSAEQRADIGDMFVAGKAAMQVVGHWRVPRYTANAEFAFDFATLPAGEYQVNRADGSCFAIGATSEHPKEAWEFVKFLAGPGSIGVDKLLELQQMVPVITEFQQSDAFLNPPGLEGSNKAAFLAGKDNLFSMYDPIHPMYSEWDALWKQELGEVWLGNTTAQDAIDYMAPLVDDMLAQIPEEERASATEEAPAEEAAEAAGDPVTIKWFMRWDQTRVDNVAMPVIEAFEAEHPNITVEFENIGSSSEYYQKLQTMVAGGLAPDVFYPATHVAYAYASKGAMGFVDEFIAADGLDMDAYDQNILQLYQYEGKQYCLPIDTANLVVFYNQDMFDAAGVAYPEDGWTWDDFLTTAQALTADTDGDGITDQFGVDQFVNYWPAVVWSQTGRNIFNDKRGPTEFLLTDPAAIEAVQWLADLINVHGVMPSAEQRADIGDMFVAGKSAMQVVGHWRVPRYLANAEFGFDFATLPAGEYQVNRADGSCFAIGATSEHPEEAWEFVKFLAGPGSIGVDKLLELQQMVPVITEFQQSDAFLNPPGLEGSNKAAFLAGKDNLFSMYDPIHPMYAEWDALWKQEFGEVWNGNTTAQDAVDYMAPLVDDMLSQIPEEERATVTEEPAEEAAAEEAPAEEAAGDPVTIKWFMRWDQTRVDNVAMPVIEAFEAENPNITVEFENIGSSSEYYQKLQTMTAGGLAPDVFYPATHVAYAFASKGAMTFVDDYIAADGLDMGAYDQNILQMYQYEGQQYCLPIDTANLVVFYNKEMFDAAGVAYPEDGWSWDDFLTTAQALTADTDDDGIIDQFGVDQFVNYWPSVVWSQTGHNIFNDMRNPSEFLLTDPAAIEAVQWVADLINVHGVMPSAEQRADIGDMFVAGKSAMQVVGHWRVPRYTANAEFAFDFATLPAGEYQVNRADGSCFAIGATSEHPEAAWEFVKFLAGPGSLGVDKLLELQQMVPVITEFQQSEAFLNPPGLEGSNKEAFLAGKDNLFSMYDPIHPMYAEWDALWKQEFGEVWLGNTTAQDAVDYMTPLVQDMLNNLSDYE